MDPIKSIETLNKLSKNRFRFFLISRISVVVLISLAASQTAYADERMLNPSVAREIGAKFARDEGARSQRYVTGLQGLTSRAVIFDAALRDHG